MKDVVPADLRDFILQHIDSVAHLEALILLRAYPQEEWNAAKVAKRLYINEQQASATLARLCEQGFLRRDEDSFRFENDVPERRVMADRLAEVFGRHLIPVTNIIHSKPRRIREFADAFKFKKDR